MSNTWGRNLRLSIFGESHGNGIGIVIDGLPPGFLVDLDEVGRQMARRAPGGSFSTPRQEKDAVEILSGLFNGKTTGAPLCGLIRNKDTRSGDYDNSMPRPGTADLTAHIKYKGYNDYRGGGHFSGRLTAPLTFAGSLARQLLEGKGICIGGHILQVGKERGKSFESLDAELLSKLTSMDFPVLDIGSENKMKDEISRAKQEGDSVGGVIECAAIGHPAGLGSPFFESIESNIASMIFSIPGTKGIEFGKGFRFAEMKGSNANDQIQHDCGKVGTKTNNTGGVNGGITNGSPIVFRTVFRPTASISKKQRTINYETNENVDIEIKGRHDPCIVRRAVVVVESVAALCLLDFMMEGRYSL